MRESTETNRPGLQDLASMEAGFHFGSLVRNRFGLAVWVVAQGLLAFAQGRRLSLVESLSLVALYHELKARPGNLFFSPYSISTSLGLVYAGARGETASEIANVLHVSLPQTNFHTVCSELLARMEELTADTRLILCNATYFKGRWALDFKPSATKPAPFFIATNQTVTVPMMHQEKGFRMAMIDKPLMALIDLPYFGRDLSMIVLLPGAVDGLPELARNLTADNLGVWLTKLDQARPHQISVHLPRFTTTQSFELDNELKSLGRPAAFDVKAADFCGIYGINYLYLADAIHKAFVEVNESGTEAAAANLFRMEAMSISGRFVADHPFIYLLRENGSGSILFLGRMVDPSKS